MPQIGVYNKKCSVFLREVCQAIIDRDPDVLAIMQFGSSIYAPESALDVDLLVVTKKRKGYEVYLDATGNAPFHVDIIPLEPDEKASKEIAAAIRGASKLLYGRREIVEGMVRDVPIPTYDEARRVISAGDDRIRMASATSDPVVQETHYRNAFNTLFDAARLAAMAFLNTEETRWGQLRGQMPLSFDSRFRQIIDTLHVEYFYLRHLPSRSIEEEYRRWRDIVLQFINDLESAERQ
jgi:hypothetical protein